MPTAMNGPIELYYETFGIQDDPVVICLPGMGNQLLIYPEEFCLALVDRGALRSRVESRLAAGGITLDVLTGQTARDRVAAIEAGQA